MSTLPNIPDPKQLAAMAPHAIDPDCVDAVVERAESHDALVKRLAKQRLAAKISSLNERDFRDAAIAALVNPRHTHMLVTAFAESADAFGDALQNLMRDEWQLQAEIEAAEIAMRIEGEQRPAHRFVRIVGDQI